MKEKLYTNIKKMLIKYSKIFWILLNMLGMYCSLLGINPEKSLFENRIAVFVYGFILFPVITGLLFGLFQGLYIKLLNRTNRIAGWILKTSLSLWLFFIFKFVFVINIFPWLSMQFGASSYNLIGIAVFFKSQNIFSEVVMTILSGSVLGIFNGLFVGLFQSSEFKQKSLRPKWIFRVTLSYLSGFLITSIVLAVCLYLLPVVNTGMVNRIGTVILGLILGVMTYAGITENFVGQDS
jgi:hypothetical protein